MINTYTKMDHWASMQVSRGNGMSDNSVMRDGNNKESSGEEGDDH